MAHLQPAEQFDRTTIGLGRSMLSLQLGDHQFKEECTAVITKLRPRSCSKWIKGSDHGRQIPTEGLAFRTAREAALHEYEQ